MSRHNLISRLGSTTVGFFIGKICAKFKGRVENENENESFNVSRYQLLLNWFAIHDTSHHIEICVRVGIGPTCAGSTTVGFFIGKICSKFKGRVEICIRVGIGPTCAGLTRFYWKEKKC
jgi:hypothetical protein